MLVGAAVLFNGIRVGEVTELGLVPDNHRARRAYEAVGFTAEGIARGSAFFHGVHRDELVMAQLRPEWEQRRSQASEASPG